MKGKQKEIVSLRTPVDCDTQKHYSRKQSTLPFDMEYSVTLHGRSDDIYEI